MLVTFILPILFKILSYKKVLCFTFCNFVTLNSVGSMDVAINAGNPIKAANQRTSEPNRKGIAATGRITSTTTFQPSLSFVSLSVLCLFFYRFINCIFSKVSILLVLLQLTPKPFFYVQCGGNWTLSHSLLF